MGELVLATVRAVGDSVHASGWVSLARSCAQRTASISAPPPYLNGNFLSRPNSLHIFTRCSESVQNTLSAMNQTLYPPNHRHL
jgi:hypothetical protein